MKISDFIFQYPTNSISRKNGICRVRIFVSADGAILAMLTELRKNTGDSVTNSIELIRGSLVRQGLISEGATVMEHYEGEERYAHTFDLVSFDGDTKWEKLTGDAAKALIGCDDIELYDATEKNARLMNCIEQVRNYMNPFGDFPVARPRDVILRSLEIQSGMVSRDTLHSLVNDGAIERELQRIIKTDLSLLGEVYGHPDGEYICFSEFPVVDGFVDFAVFTGRSRMDVVLIEIKGADFFLVNADSYAGFSRNINQAADQVRRRLGCAYKDPETFRQKVHQIRDVVESAGAVYQSFQGPEGKLKVDPEKEINVYGVVIGGRTRNDRDESSKRHEYERFSAPHIRIE